MLCLTDLHTEQIRARAKASLKPEAVKSRRLRARLRQEDENVLCMYPDQSTSAATTDFPCLRGWTRASMSRRLLSAALHEQGYVVDFLYPIH